LARSAARLKMGFFPLPEPEARKIQSLLSFPFPCSVIDPCAGQGTALNLITEGAQVERHGIELDTRRAEQAAATGIRMIQGNVFDTHAKVESFSLLYLNPPYDSEINLSGNCLNVGGVGIDQSVSRAFLEALTPAALEATTLAIEQLESSHDAALSQWRLEVERARYAAERAERQYKSVEPENRLVCRGLEKEWETRLQTLAQAEAELSRRERQRPRKLSEEEKKKMNTLGSDLRLVWTAPTTSDRDRKELLRTLLEEVILKVERKQSHADITLRWRGGMTTKLELPLKRYQVQGPTTDEDTLSLLHRLAAHYPDDTIAGILNRQGRKTAYGERFTAQQVGSLRRYHEIPRFEPSRESRKKEAVPIIQAAKILGVAPSTLHRWINAGLIKGEQLTPGAPWQIRITEELRHAFVDTAPPDYVPVVDAMRRLGLSRQTVWQRVKRGELEALHVRQGQRKGLRIKVVDPPTGLFDQS